MNQQQLKRMTEDKGFIAALDQSGIMSSIGVIKNV